MKIFGIESKYRNMEERGAKRRTFILMNCLRINNARKIFRHPSGLESIVFVNQSLHLITVIEEKMFCRSKYFYIMKFFT